MTASIAILVISGSGISQGQNTTSPLAILQQAPQVRLDDPTPTPAASTRTPIARTPIPQAIPQEDDSIPYRPPAGPAPVIEPAYPAVTPYAGNTVGGGQRPASDYYSAPSPGVAPARPANTPPLYVRPGPTPRPVLGPEDVEPKKKRGFVRGLINAIPFVGDDEEDETPALVEETPGPEMVVPPEEPMYRGYETTPLSEPILLPPGASPVRDRLPEDPQPSSPSSAQSAAPPILTPTPRAGVVPGTSADTLLQDPVEQTGSRPVLTVKRESDSTTTLEEPAGSAPAGGIELKAPAVSDRAEETPRPLERATTAVVIQNSRTEEVNEVIAPVEVEPAEDPDESLGPRPDPSASRLKPFDPTATPEPQAEAEDLATTLTIEQSDLGMPNPTYEQNAVILGEFQEAVRKARIDDYETAARMFRDYAQNHPSSGLAPRAYFLSIIFEKDRVQARENLEAMERLFPESRYVKTAAERRPDVVEPAAVASEVPNETPRQAVERLERELTASVGDPARESELRKNLGVAYLNMDEHDRAFEVLRPALEISRGQPSEGEVLLALGRVLVNKRETVQAISLFEAAEEKDPDLIYRDAPSAWSVGLAYEGIGRYTKARTIYNRIRQRWPDAPEAGWAQTRLNELAALAE